MASIGKDAGGRRRILFVAPDGKRKTVRLGKVSQREAEAIRTRIEQLLAAVITGHPVPRDLASWLADCPDVLANRLAAVGLVPKRDPTLITLDAFLTNYIAGRTDVKPLTTRHLNDARRNLIRYFGKNALLSDVTPGDADEYRRDLLRRLGENTVRRMCGRAKQFFRAAHRKRLLAENPFGDMKDTSVKANRSRDHFVTREDISKVIDACPDAQWRLIVALARYAGIRIPSELLTLTWDCIDWDRDRIRIQSPKTEHHEGHEERVIPLFPELRPHLERVWEDAEPGTQHVITRYRTANTNLRTQLIRIIHKAGLKTWPKLFHNMRATRETELAQTFPIHVVCAWIGNSQTVAAKHYLQVTDEHFQDAASAAQNPAQQTRETGRNGSQPENPRNEKTPILPGIASDCGMVHSCSVPPEGLEPVEKAVGTDRPRSPHPCHGWSGAAARRERAT